VNRRSFITVLGGAAASWPIAMHAQQSTNPVIGFLGSPSAAEWAQFAAAFRQGLQETGYVDGQDAAIQYRWADGPSISVLSLRRRESILLEEFEKGKAAP
jgi:putative ABC transport system substrate-binding protein